MSKYVKIYIYNMYVMGNNPPQHLVKEKEKKHMKNEKEFETYVDFLVGLFEIIEFKYSCTKIKLGKLLSIAAFLDAINNQGQNPIFGDVKIYEYKNCGTQILRLEEMGGVFSNYSVCPIQGAQITEDEQQRIEKKVNEQIDNKCNFELIKNVFLVFGEKTPGELGSIITDFLNKGDNDIFLPSSIKKFSKYVNLEYIRDNYQLFKNSTLYMFYTELNND